MTTRLHSPSGRPERTLLAIPYDWRRPTWRRVKSRVWNAADPRVFTPKPFGHGHVINGYWVVHPLQYRKRHRRHVGHP